MCLKIIFFFFVKFSVVQILPFIFSHKEDKFDITEL